MRAGGADCGAAGAVLWRTFPGTAALWMAALCPFTADYTAVVLSEVLATFFTTLAVLVFIYFSTDAALDASARTVGRGKINFLCGLVLAAGNYRRAGFSPTAGHATGFICGRDCAVHLLVAVVELAEAGAGDLLDVRGFVVAAGAMGGAELADIWLCGISGPALRADVRRFYSAGVFRMDRDMDDAIWRFVSGDAQAGE